MLLKAKELLTGSPTLPMRKGKRPITIRGPLHVQCSDHGSDGRLRQLVKEVVAWPGIEPSSLPVAGADLACLRVAEGVASDDPAVFIAGREFGRVHFGAPTIYLILPLSWAHWTIMKGWAEPHFSCSFGLIPPGVMVIYTPRDEQELAVIRRLFSVSYSAALRAQQRKAGESALPCPGFKSNEKDQAFALAHGGGLANPSRKAVSPSYFSTDSHLEPS